MSRRSVALIVLFFVVTRVVLVASSADVFGYGEELAKGAAAKALIDHPPIPYHELAYVPHEGGGFVVTHLKALAFLAIGESLLAHKLVALATSLLVLAAGLALARECFGARAATIFGVLVALAPDSFLRFSLLSLGTHFEALLFEALVLRYAFRILRGERDPLDWVKLGLAAGFGLYFSLVTVAATLAAGAYLVFGLRTRILGRGLVLAIGAALVGLVPLFAMLSKVGLDAVRVRGTDVTAAHGTSFARSLADLYAPLAKSGAHDDAVQIGVVAIAVLLGAACVRERSFRLPFLGVLGFLALYLALYFASGFAVGTDGHWFLYLRMSPVWFFATLLASAALARWYERRPAWALAAIALLVAAGLADLARVARTGRPDRPLANLHELATTRGVDYVEYFDKLEPRLAGDDRARIQALLALRDDSVALPAAIAHSTFEHSGSLPFDAILLESRAAFGPRFGEALLGLGHALHPNESYDVSAAFAALERAPAELRHDLAIALGRTGLGPRYRRDRLQEQIDTPVPAEHRAEWLVGTGYRVDRAFRLDREAADAFVARQSEADRAPLAEGLRLARAESRLP